MKLNKKKVFVVALAISLVAIISMGTLAWFTDTDRADNNFFVTNSNTGNPDKIFSVDVTENVADDGKPSQPVDAGYDFKDILPGDVLEKQPFVSNKGSYDQFVRVTVTISDYAAFNTALTEGFEVKDVFVGLNLYDATLNPNGELVLDSHNEDRVNDVLEYTFYVNKIVASGEAVRLFDKVLVPTALDQDDFAKTTLKDGFSIDIYAEAVQTENVGVDNMTKDAAAAKIAFKSVGMENVPALEDRD